VVYFRAENFPQTLISKELKIICKIFRDIYALQGRGGGGYPENREERTKSGANTKPFPPINSIVRVEREIICNVNLAEDSRRG
jgi:hypothetical protein